MTSAKANSLADPPNASETTVVSFVVPAHNEQRHLEQCLRSIQSQAADSLGDVKSSLVVVDNESIDATAQIATECGARVVRVPPGNPGRARNAGAAAVDSDFVAFVDADCVLPDGWLEQCLGHFADRDVVAVGSVQAAASAEAPWVERVWVSAIVPKTDGDWTTAEWLPAFNLMVRKSEFDAIGRFDEALDTCEDSDLSFRLAKRGQLRRDHTCPVQHLGESHSIGEFFRRELWRSRGNFDSARKRGSVSKELISLYLPVAYLLLVILSAIATRRGRGDRTIMVDRCRGDRRVFGSDAVGHRDPQTWIAFVSFHRRAAGGLSGRTRIGAAAAQQASFKTVTFRRTTDDQKIQVKTRTRAVG